MEEEEEVEGQVCENCQNPHMLLVGGLLVCGLCGYQSQAHQEEDDGDEGGNLQVKRQRTFRKERKPDDPMAKLNTLDECVILYCTALQNTLMGLGKFLSEQYQVGPQFASLIRRLWISRVALSEIFEEPFSEMRYGRNLNAAWRDPGSEDKDKYILSEAYLRFRMMKVLPPESIIEVLFLGLLYMKAPVTPMDLSREIFTGKLPFFKEFINVCSESDNENTFHILHPPHLKSIKLNFSGAIPLLQNAAYLASLIDLKLPTINSEAIIEKYCSDFGFPMKLCRGVWALLSWLKLQGTGLYIAEDNLNPYVQLMAIFIVVIKTLYMRSLCPALNFLLSIEDLVPWDLKPKEEVDFGSDFNWRLWAKMMLEKISEGQPNYSVTGRIPYEDLTAASQWFSENGLDGNKTVFEGLKQVHSAMSRTFNNEKRPETNNQDNSDFEDSHMSRETKVEYLILVGSAYCWITPKFIDRFILDFEKKMLTAEKDNELSGALFEQEFLPKCARSLMGNKNLESGNKESNNAAAQDMCKKLHKEYHEQKVTTMDTQKSYLIFSTKRAKEVERNRKEMAKRQGTHFSTDSEEEEEF